MLTSVIVPAWRGGTPPPVAALLESVSRSVTIPLELVVVCNGSDPDLTEYLRDSLSITRLAFLTQNAGVARAWNIGAHLALGDVLIFVNEDLVVGPGTIEALSGALRDDKSLGVVGPKGTNWTVSPSAIRHKEYVSDRELVECDVVSGFLFAVRRDVLAAAGYFDDELSPCSYEEVDFAQAIRRIGKRSCALGGLDYRHEWGVSSWKPERVIEWLGRAESLEQINRRNEARVTRKWGVPTQNQLNPGDYYDAAYFARGDYLRAMTQRRTIGGRFEPPLVATMADVIEATGFLPKGGALLDIGCSYGLLVQELVARGYDPFGIDFSAEVVAASPVRERLTLGDALMMPVGRRYDVVFVGDVYQHLNDAEAKILTEKVAAASGTLIVVVNKSRHDPRHVNIKSNREWLKLFADGGFGLEYRATQRARYCYLTKSAGTEMWHANLLVLSKRAHSIARRTVASVFGDGAPVWRIAGALKAFRRGGGSEE